MACIAILLSSFMTSIASALEARQAGDLTPHEICTAEGVKTVEFAPGSAASPPAKHQGHAQDCPYCRLQSDSPALPPALHAVSHHLTTGSSRPHLFHGAPERRFVRVAANPRAPPRFS